MKLWLHAVLCVAILIIPEAFAAPNAGSYYSSNGGITDSCKVTACDYSTANCPAGKYLINCGGTQPGTCANCQGPPTIAGSNAVWTSNGGSSGSSTGCQWGCNAGYGKDSTSSSCIINTCTGQGLGVANSVFIDSSYLVCTWQCSAGYFGATLPGAKGPTSCTECTQGTFTAAANSAAACTPCAAGKFSADLHAIACSDCGADTYTLPTDSGKTSCSTCMTATPACEIGKWRSNCGGTNVGSCVSCSGTS